MLQSDPTLDTLGKKTNRHGGVAVLPGSLYTAVIMIPLLLASKSPS